MSGSLERTYRESMYPIDEQCVVATSGRRVNCWVGVQAGGESFIFTGSRKTHGANGNGGSREDRIESENSTCTNNLLEIMILSNNYHPPPILLQKWQ